MDNKLKRYMGKSLKRIKSSRLGVVEKISLWSLAKSDAKNDLPREDEEGNWISATIQREMDACNETHQKVYGTVEIELEDKYKRVDQLINLVEQKRRQIQELESELPAELSVEERRARKFGEQHISESQVAGRREREHNSKTARKRNQINRMREESNAHIEELIDIRNYLIQVETEADSVCNRLSKHMHQRIDYYWNKALHYSMKRDREIPPSCKIGETTSIAEKYKSKHASQREALNKIIDYKKEEVA